MDSRRSPTIRLLAGLAITLSAVAVYSGYTIVQLRSLQRFQSLIADRSRTDSLLLLRIQNSLNSLALAMRDMLEGSEPYPLTAWRSQFQRIRADLEDALTQEERYSPQDRSSDQRRYLGDSVAQFWDAMDRMFSLAGSGHEAQSRDLIRLSLEARQEALSSAVARLLIQNNEGEQAAGERTRSIYSRAEKNVYLLLAAIVILISVTGLYLVQSNRRMFQETAELSDRRSELAQQLISLQENAFRSISRELHDDFGQILTAIGVMLQRTGRRDPELRELQEIVQSTLDKVRSLSHALHPVSLDEAGFESALDSYLPGFEKQTGIPIDYRKSGPSRELDRGVAIHLYRIMQEALNNVARHSRSPRAAVRLNYRPESVVLEIEDEGIGFGDRQKQGMGLVSMRERAEMVHGCVEFLDREGGGALVRLTVPWAALVAVEKNDEARA